MSGNIGAKDLKINVGSGKEPDLFKWFLACYFFGHRISQEIAVATWKVFVENKLTSPQKISEQSWQHLVNLLGEGHYKRYDESTARNLHEMATFLKEKYQGKITNLLHAAENKQDLSGRLQEIKGVGPKVTEIFLRDVKI
jgi:endonuclease III